MSRTDWCIAQHRETNHFYDTYLPYEFHLRMVAQVGSDFIHLIEKESGTLQTQEEKLMYINQKYLNQKKLVDAKKLAYIDEQDRYNKALSDLEDNVRKYEANPSNYDKQAYADLLKKQKKIRQMYANLESQRQDINTAVTALNALVTNSNTIKKLFSGCTPDAFLYLPW